MGGDWKDAFSFGKVTHGPEGALGKTHRKKGKMSRRVLLLESCQYFKESMNFGAVSPRPWRKTT